MPVLRGNFRDPKIQDLGLARFSFWATTQKNIIGFDISVNDAVTMRGCDTAQGFYIRQPLQADELASWIDSKAGNGERWGSITPTAC